MKPWRTYQQNVASLLEELGFTTEVDARLTSARGVTHAVDVAARRTVAGVAMLWIIECKLWNRPVPKEKVAALVEIADDLGADRGLLMSETGFQSGALQMAAGRNITLSGLAELRANAAEDLIAAREKQAEQRLLDLDQRVFLGLREPGPDWADMLSILAAGISAEDRADLAARPAALDLELGLAEMILMASGPSFMTAFTDRGSDRDPAATDRRWKDGVDSAEATAVAEEVTGHRQLLNQAKAGQWPVLYDRMSTSKLAWSTQQLLDVVEPALTRLEQQVSAQEHRVGGTGTSSGSADGAPPD